MKKAFSLILVSALALGGCGAVRDSGLNPFNWFGASRSVATSNASGNTLIPTKTGGGMFSRPAQAYQGQPVEQITDLVIERVPGGAVMRVTAVAATQGSHDVRLISDDEGDAINGVLSFTLKASVDPRYARLRGPERGRTITAARFISNQKLESVRSLRVQGATNARVSARR